MAKHVKKTHTQTHHTKSGDETLGILAHILGLFTSFVGALVILLASKDKSAKVHAKNALNWQLSLILYFIVSFILIFVLIGFVLMIALTVLNIVFCIIAAVKASEGEVWHYPLTIKFLK